MTMPEPDYRRSFRCSRCQHVWQVEHAGGQPAWDLAEVCPECHGHGVTLSTTYLGDGVPVDEPYKPGSLR